MLDDMNVELATRVNELSAEQIGNLALSITNMLDTFSNSYEVDQGEVGETDLQYMSSYEDILGMKLLLAELASEGIV